MRLDEFLGSGRPTVRSTCDMIALAAGWTDAGDPDDAGYRLMLSVPEFRQRLASVSPDGSVTVGLASYLLTEIFSLDRSLFYRMVPSPRYSARHFLISGWTEKIASEPLLPYEVIDLIRLATTNKGEVMPQPSEDAEVGIPEIPARGTETPIIDFGFDLSINQSFSIDANDMSFHTDKLDGWLSLEVSPEFMVLASAGILLNNLYLINLGGGNATLYPQLSVAKAYGTFELREMFFSYKAGYVNLGSSASPVLNDTVFGAEAELSFNNSTVALGFGYTGFTFAKNDTIIMNGADRKASGVSGIRLGIDGAMRLSISNRLIERISYSVPFLKSHRFNIALTAQQDLRPESDFQTLGVDYEPLGSLYGEFSINGALHSDLFYAFDMTPMFNFGSAENIFAFLMRGKIDWYLREVQMSPSLSLQLGLATGRSGTVLGNFNPISGIQPGLVFQPGVGNVGWSDLQINIKPADWIGISFQNLFYMRLNGTAPTSNLNSFQDDSDGINFIGGEFSLAANFRPASDLGFSAKVGLFFPNASLLMNKTKFYFSLYGSLSF